MKLVTGQEGARGSRDLQIPARWGLRQVTSAPSSPAHAVITIPPSLSGSATKMQLQALKALWPQEVSGKLSLAIGMNVLSSPFYDTFTTAGGFALSQRRVSVKDPARKTKGNGLFQIHSDI